MPTTPTSGTTGSDTMESQRKVLVNADALARLLARVAPEGFVANDLGVCFVDDGSGVANRIEARSDVTA